MFKNLLNNNVEIHNSFINNVESNGDGCLFISGFDNVIKLINNHFTNIKSNSGSITSQNNNLYII